MVLRIYLPQLIAVLLLTFAAGSSAAPSGGCSSKTSPEVGVRHNKTLHDLDRRYMYFLPKTYKTGTPSPLILSFHGASRTSDWQANLDLLTDPFFNNDHIVVYPQALQYGHNSTYIYWQGAPNATADDIGYVSAVLDELESTLCIDTSRVYATGKSQGGGLVGRLACDGTGTGARFAAFAPVSGAFYTGASTCGDADPGTLSSPCDPRRGNVPVLGFHGGNDTTISIKGGDRAGGCLPDVRAWIEAWARRDQIGTDPGPKQDLAGEAQVFQYGSGPNKGLVTFVYDGPSVNHDWPSTMPNTDSIAHGSEPTKFNASSMIMDFFARFQVQPVSGGGGGNATSTATSKPTSTAAGAVVPSGTSGAPVSSADAFGMRSGRVVGVTVVLGAVLLTLF